MLFRSLTRSINLNIPLVSAAMDTVTEARLAIAIAQEGGIGIVHKNMTIPGQAGEVAKVKRFESGVVKEPITITQNMTVRDVLGLTQQHRISGLPVIDSAGRVVGIVKNGSSARALGLRVPHSNREWMTEARDGRRFAESTGSECERAARK